MAVAERRPAPHRAGRVRRTRPFDQARVLEARWRVRGLSSDAIELVAHEMLRDLPRAATADDQRCAHVTSVELHGGGAARAPLYWTMQTWAEVVGRWLETAWPEERTCWLDAEESKLGVKGEQFLVRRMQYDDPLAFAWPFDVAYPVGLLIDLLHSAHVRGTAIVGVTARL